MKPIDEDAPKWEPIHRPTFSEPPHNGTERKRRRFKVARRRRKPERDGSPYLESGDRLREMA